jgi:hypothetical protein
MRGVNSVWDGYIVHTVVVDPNRVKKKLTT